MKSLNETPMTRDASPLGSCMRTVPVVRLLPVKPTNQREVHRPLNISQRIHLYVFPSALFFRVASKPLQTAPRVDYCSTRCRDSHVRMIRSELQFLAQV